MECLLAMESYLITNRHCEEKTFGDTPKITRAISKIALGLQQDLFMGNLDSKRDWETCQRLRLWRCGLYLQQEVAEDYVIATGVTTKVRDSSPWLLITSDLK